MPELIPTSFQIRCIVKTRPVGWRLSEGHLRSMLARFLQEHLDTLPRFIDQFWPLVLISSLEVHEETPRTQELRKLAEELVDNEDVTIDEDAAVSIIENPEAEGLEAAQLAGHVQVWQYVQIDKEEP